MSVAVAAGAPAVAPIPLGVLLRMRTALDGLRAPVDLPPLNALSVDFNFGLLYGPHLAALAALEQAHRSATATAALVCRARMPRSWAALTGRALCLLQVTWWRPPSCRWTR